MSSKQIYLIRHGETELNRQNIIQGSGVDAQLNEKGHRQAQAFFAHYQHIAFAKVYTSKLIRTIQSVQGFLDLGIPHETHAGLNEISWGRKEGHKVTPENDELYFEMLRQWRSGNVDVAIEGGESPLTVAARQKPVLELILSRPDEETILICMHGRAMRILLCQLLKIDLKDMDRFEHENLCLYKLHYQNGHFEIELSNNNQHLAGI
ncbi:MAG: histidine phosphatase family protein [Microscillaceae bacterium]|nr:histidine phosphatase family protein [Microscillaceae bacterium]